jgi:hypothetical protein
LGTQCRVTCLATRCPHLAPGRCVFGEAMTHDDTVCLTLYRRVFPPNPGGGAELPLDSDGDEV